MSAYNMLIQAMSKEEELAFYNAVLDKVIQNPRFYLDNLDTLDEFRVSFLHNYDGKEKKKKAL